MTAKELIEYLVTVPGNSEVMIEVDYDVEPIVGGIALKDISLVTLYSSSRLYTQLK